MRVKKTQVENLFINHYFKNSNLCSKRGKKKKGGFSLFNPKTINADYINFVFESPVFTLEFFKYVSLELLPDYEDSRDPKLAALIEKCSEFFSKPDGEAEIADYIEKNKKCKLPWSRMEVRLAQDAILKLFVEKQVTF